jgi:putative spermidine/putrescine transport system ATP-binding protein
LREEIRRIQSTVGTTTLFVTHDQEEALAVADRVGVMRAGRLEQLAPPAEIYQRPATAFVADFVGLSNRLPGLVSGSSVEVLGQNLPLISPAAAGAATALVRPEAVSIIPADDGNGTVLTSSFLGSTSRVTATVGDVTVFGQVASGSLPSLPVGTRVQVTVQPIPVALEN